MAQPTMAAVAGLKETYIQLKTRMDKADDDFRKALIGTRTGRASVHMLDSVSVDAYGAQMPLNQVATVHTPEPQLITVQPFDPSQLGAIEKSIRQAELGLNQMNDGKIIRVPIPPLTEERRKDLVKRQTGLLQGNRAEERDIQVRTPAGNQPVGAVVHHFHGIKRAELAPRIDREFEFRLDPPCHDGLMVSVVHDEHRTPGKIRCQFTLEPFPG